MTTAARPVRRAATSLVVLVAVSSLLLLLSSSSPTHALPLTDVVVVDHAEQPAAATNQLVFSTPPSSANDVDADGDDDDDDLSAARPVLGATSFSFRPSSSSPASAAAAAAAAPLVVDPPTKPGGGWIWSSCGLDSDAVEIQAIDVTPDPPKPGQNLTVVAKGVVRSTIDEGTYADVVVKLGLIKLLTRRFDICEEARNAHAELQCPLAPGEYEITQVVQLPREIPPAKFNVHVQGATADGVDLTCLDVAINFMPRRGG